MKRGLVFVVLLFLAVILAAKAEPLVASVATSPSALMIPLSGQINISNIFMHYSWSIVITGFLLLGILLGLTPCAIPLILIMSSICRDQPTIYSKPRALALSMVYVFALAITYAVLGASVAVFGLCVKAYFQNWWVIVTVSTVFFVLGFSSLGLFNLHLPKRWLRAMTAHRRFEGYGSYVEAMLMGVLATLIAAPCVIAPLIGVLTYIANTGDSVFGAVACFFAGIGFGIPLIAFFVFGSQIISQAGEWQKHIRQLFGLLLLGIAIWVLGRIVTAHETMYLWAGLTMFTAVYMGVLIKEENEIESEEEHAVCSLDGEVQIPKQIKKRNMGAVIKMVSVMILLYGMIIFVGALLGNENPFSPLDHQINSTVVTPEK